MYCSVFLPIGNYVLKTPHPMLVLISLEKQLIDPEMLFSDFNIDLGEGVDFDGQYN